MLEFDRMNNVCWREGIRIDRWNVPIYEALRRYARSNPVRFHMPGHMAGKGIPDVFKRNWEEIDVTEIPDMDNLHSPRGVISEAQTLAARAFGADRTFFLVNGSTCGMQAVIMTICRPGDRLLVARDAHRSVIAGMMLAGAEPVYIKPEYDRKFGITTILEPGSLKRALEENPDVAGVLITRPTYYGYCSDIEEIARIAHSHGKVLAVDEAHGAHLCFSGSLPVCAMKGGADICVQSAHKTLPALTQGSYLHVKGNIIDVDRLEFYLRLLQTSSPSYMIMAFLDIARAVMERDGSKLLAGLLEDIERFEEEASRIERISLHGRERRKYFERDRSRIVVNTGGLGITGYQAEKFLREDHNIQVEMSDFSNIVCIATPAVDCRSFDALAAALRDLGLRCRNRHPLGEILENILDIPETGIELGKICTCDARAVDLKESAGSVSMDFITPYPPGIPVVCPGEVIPREAVFLAESVLESGGRVQGLIDGERIRVAV